MKTATVIGAGNVAWHLANALVDNDVEVLHIVSRRLESAAPLADRVGAVPLVDISNEYDEPDIYIVAVSDDQIGNVVNELSDKESWVVHTSGATGMDVFKKKKSHYGVMYPLQTFSKERKLEFREVPLLLEVAEVDNLNELEEFASRLSNCVSYADSEARAVVHVAAVFACNFTNRLVAIAMELLKEKGLDADLLKPLVHETVEKLDEMDPIAAQTGPALRGDENTIKKHLKLLANHPDWQKMYTFISREIKG